MKLLLVLSLVFLSVSCGTSKTGVTKGKMYSLYRSHLSVDQDHHLSNGMPNYVLSQEILKLLSQKRAPAGEESLTLSREVKTVSLRRLYFRTLYEQYKNLNAFLNQETQMKYCPSFHHDRVLLDEEVNSLLNFNFKVTKPEQEHLVFYPEWMLPSPLKPLWVRTKFSPEKMNEALFTHAKKIKNELEELCEEGSSDAYFRLENMETYFAGRDNFTATQRLQALLKIPVFSTLLLLKVTQFNLPTLTKDEHEMLTRLNAHVFYDYIAFTHRARVDQRTGKL